MFSNLYEEGILKMGNPTQLDPEFMVNDLVKLKDGSTALVRELREGNWIIFLRDNGDYATLHKNNITNILNNLDSEDVQIFIESAKKI